MKEEQKKRQRNTLFGFVDIFIVVVAFIAAIGLCRHLNRHTDSFNVSSLQETFPKGSSIYGIYILMYVSGYDERICGSNGKSTVPDRVLRGVCFDKRIDEGKGISRGVSIRVTYDDRGKVVAITPGLSSMMIYHPR